MRSNKRAAELAVVIVLVGVTFGAGELRKQYRFPVGSKASVTVINQYGPISVKPTTGNQVVVDVVLYSNKVEVDQTQSGNRVDMLSHLLAGADQNSGRVDYEVQVPSDASVTLQSNTGPVHAEKLGGDVTVEGTTAKVDVQDVSNAHVHIKTLGGPVTLNNIQNGHVEVTSVSGDITLTAVSGSLVQVNSTTGKIHYDGDFGLGGDYVLSSHTGDIEATAPSYASIDVTARSIRGKVENDFPLEPKHTNFAIRAGSAFAGTMGKAASSVKLSSFSGKIHLKKR